MHSQQGQRMGRTFQTTESSPSIRRREGPTIPPRAQLQQELSIAAVQTLLHSSCSQAYVKLSLGRGGNLMQRA